MKKIRVIAAAYPALTMIVTAVLFILILNVGSLILLINPAFFSSLDEYTYSLIPEIFVSLVGILAVYLLVGENIFKEKKKPFFSGCLVGGYFVFAGIYTLMAHLLLMLWDYLETQTVALRPVWQMGTFLLLMFFIGFAEEVFFRGIGANLLLKKYGSDKYGVWTATVISGVVFGLMHVSNAIGGADIVGVAVQAVVASAMGIAFTAIYYRTKNIWVTVFLHAFIDFCALFPSGVLQSNASLNDTIGSYNPFQFISLLPYAAVALVLLRPSKTAEIIDTSLPIDLPKSKKRFYIAAGICGGAAILFAITATAIWLVRFIQNPSLEMLGL